MKPPKHSVDPKRSHGVKADSIAGSAQIAGKPSLPLGREALYGAALGLVPVVFALFCWSASSSFALGVDDSVTSFQPVWTDSMRQLWSGRLPLWSHHSAGGMPLFARGQGTLHPGAVVSHVLGLIGNRRDAEVVICHLLHIWLGSLFSWLYLRNNGCRPSAAATGALGFAFAGPLWGFWTNWNTFAFVSAVIPMTLLVIDRMFASRGSWLLVLALGLCAGLVTQIGDPQLIVKYLLLSGLYAAVRMPPANFRSGLWMLIGGMLLGGLLGGAQCLATAEYISQTSRGDTRDASDAFRLSLEPRHLASVVDPFYQATIAPALWPEQTIYGAGLFFGPLLPFALGAAARREWWKRPVTRAITVLLVLYALFSLGNHFPLNRLSLLIPVINQMRWPLRWTLEMCALGPLLIGLAIEDVLRLFGERKVFLWSALGCAVAVGLQVFLTPTGVPLLSPQAVLAGHAAWWLLDGTLLALQRFRQARAFAGVAVAWTIVAGLMAVPIAQANRFSNPDLRQLRNQPLTVAMGENDRVLTLFRKADRQYLGGNGNYCFSRAHQFQGRSVCGYFYPFEWQSWRYGFNDQGEIYDQEGIEAIYFDPQHRGLLQLLRIGAVLALPHDEAFLRKLNAHPDFEHVQTTPWVAVYRHKGFREAAWFVEEIVIAGQIPGALDLAGMETPHLAVCTVASVGTGGSRQTFAAGKVTSFREHHDRIDIQVQCPQDGFLVVNTTWHPDWKVTANHQPTPVVLTNGGFMGVLTPKGTTEISLRFRPAWRFLVIPLAAGFWVVLAVWIAGCVLEWRNEKKRSGPTALAAKAHRAG